MELFPKTGPAWCRTCFVALEIAVLALSVILKSIFDLQRGSATSVSQMWGKPVGSSVSGVLAAK